MLKPTKQTIGMALFEEALDMYGESERELVSIIDRTDDQFQIGPQRIVVKRRRQAVIDYVAALQGER